MSEDALTVQGQTLASHVGRRTLTLYVQFPGKLCQVFIGALREATKLVNFNFE